MKKMPTKLMLNLPGRNVYGMEMVSGLLCKNYRVNERVNSKKHLLNHTVVYLNHQNVSLVTKADILANEFSLTHEKVFTMPLSRGQNSRPEQRPK